MSNRRHLRTLGLLVTEPAFHVVVFAILILWGLWNGLAR